MNMSNHSCKLCNSETFQLIRKETDRSVIKCLSCGLYQVGDFPEEETIEQIYEEEYFKGNETVGYSNYLSLEKRLKELSKQRWKFLTAIIGKRDFGSILDIGCATGEFLDTAQKNGWSALGIEISKFASEIAKKRYGLQIITGALKDQCIPENTFDVITMWDVIEHLSYPQNDLKIINKSLKDEGFLLICTPNVGSLRSKREGSDWYGYRVSREHLLFFSRKTIEKMLEETNFKVIYSQTTVIDSELRALINPFKEYKNIAIPSMKQEYQKTKITNVKNLVYRTLEDWFLGHILIVIAKRNN